MFGKHFIKYFTMMFVLVLASMVITATDVASAADEYDDLREKWKVILTGGTAYNPADPRIAARIAKIDNEAESNWNSMITAPNRTCLWSDVCSITDSNHMRFNYDRLKAMALAYATKGSAMENDPTLLADLSDALDWMYDNRYNEGTTLYGSWWDWEIGAPLSLNDIVVLLYEDLTQSQVTNYMNAVYQFSPIVTKTGANRAWMSIIVGVRGIIVKDSGRIAAAGGGGLGPIFQYTTLSGDGFYTDGSFIQHEKHPYTGGYGNSLLKEVSSLMYVLDGSTWEVTNPARHNVFRWVYDSFEPVMYKGALMDMVRGREISRPYNEDHVAGHTAMQSIIKLAKVAPAGDSLAFKKMIKHWIEEDTFRSYYEDASIHMIVLADEIMQDQSIQSGVDLIKHQVFSS